VRTFSYLEPKMWNRQASLKNEDAPQALTTGSAARGCPEEQRRKIAWVGKSVAFKGELVSAEDMALDGQVEGTINVRDHSLTIGPDADIRADIVGKIVIIRGRVKGQIIASEKIHLHETASVEGGVSSPTIVIADGARLEGRLETLKQTRDAQPQTV
jgi:cytoskeletal protein CcmA (bactofilin family)